MQYYEISVRYMFERKNKVHPFFGFSVRGAIAEYLAKNNKNAYISLIKRAKKTVKGHISIPKPYAIRDVVIDQRLSFSLILAEPYKQYLNDLITCFENIETIGSKRNKLYLESINILRNKLFKKIKNKIRIKFITPMILIREGKLMMNPDLYSLMMNAARRYWSIYKEDVDFYKIGELYKNVIGIGKTYVVGFQHWSRKRKLEMIKGVKGYLDFEGVGAGFYNLFGFMEVFGCGKWTSAGMGQIRIQNQTQ